MVGLADSGRAEAEIGEDGGMNSGSGTLAARFVDQKDSRNLESVSSIVESGSHTAAGHERLTTGKMALALSKRLACVATNNLRATF